MRQYVNVPVPEERVFDVFRFLSGLESSPTEVVSTYASPDLAPSPVKAEANAEEGNDIWPPELLERFSRRSSEKVNQLMDYLAERPDQRVPVAEVWAELGYDGRQMGGMIGGASKRAERYGRKNLPWRWLKQGRIWTYYMPRQHAEVLRNLRVAPSDGTRS